MSTRFSERTLVGQGLIAGIGHTPLVRLNRLTGARKVHFYAKLELQNPGGSIKDRAAGHIIRRALEAGRIRAGDLVVESSSGNMGIGLAQVCAYYGLRFVCVVDPRASKQNVAIMRAYGATVEVITDPDPISGEFLPARISRVKAIVADRRNAFWPDQYSNLDNSGAHHETMREVAQQLGGRVDYLFCAPSTSGTVRGCVEYARSQQIAMRMVAVDAVGSVLFGGRPGKRLIPGHGASIKPDLHQPELVDRVVPVTDFDCVIGCRRLVRLEGILAGGSSGGIVTAFERILDTIEDHAICVAILADRGERYLDTIYSDQWVAEHFGDQAALAERIAS